VEVVGAAASREEWQLTTDAGVILPCRAVALPRGLCHRSRYRFRPRRSIHAWRLSASFYPCLAIASFQQGPNWVRSDKTQVEHNESALTLIADIPRDMDFRCNGPDSDIPSRCNRGAAK
jgi:hypothetical protein